MKLSSQNINFGMYKAIHTIENQKANCSRPVIFLLGKKMGTEASKHIFGNSGDAGHSGSQQSMGKRKERVRWEENGTGQKSSHIEEWLLLTNFHIEDGDSSDTVDNFCSGEDEKIFLKSLRPKEPLTSDELNMFLSEIQS